MKNIKQLGALRFTQNSIRVITLLCVNKINGDIMPNPSENRSSTIKSILVGIAVMVLGTILIYFLKFFGFSIRAILMKSISQASNSELYANTLLILAICLFGLIAFIVSSLLSRKDYEDIQRKKLGVFLLDEIERLKKERQDLKKRPTPTSEAVFAQMKEEGRFLDGQEEILLYLSRWIKPPES